MSGGIRGDKQKQKSELEWQWTENDNMINWCIVIGKSMWRHLGETTGVAACYLKRVRDSIRPHDNIILYLRDISFLLLHPEETSLQHL